MQAILKLLAVIMITAQGAYAQSLSALARVDPEQSKIEEGWFGKTSLTLGLSQGVPFRVFLLNDPARLVVDFREVDWTGLSGEDLLPEPGAISDIRFGSFQPGWSRLVADLAEPMIPDQIAMPVDQNSGTARLEIILKEVSQDRFAKAAGVAVDPSWTMSLAPRKPMTKRDDGRFVVALDPGHGGIDPGAQTDGVDEKDLMLRFALSLSETLQRSGVDVVLTRSEDVFVALETRVAIAHQAQADMFISLHADSLTQGGAKGATVYTLSDEASDAATAHLAARHNRADIIAGVDLTGSDDQVASILLDLARQETEPRSTALAQVLSKGMAAAGGPMNSRPLRRAGFSVLKSADIPSVLVEIGFLSSKRDLNNLRDPIWRAVMVNAMADAILAWRDQDEARKPLIRQ
ncbi:N-acetylmuramoyl-L-alanine amidase [Sulfitobacter mediterraneus]|uniref:N-acetylmuramoyl-L-alanine amidase n=1 Tax=Sulfitobacter mediterraneus TaxID=83219 RepID=A0A2T6CH17_9RHOB|nr:N-acetylmuramoyl-L-alanine amidase [Sulfitobacter mediterraneus]KIN77318.1 N-acetylmuramoyl-L-alanine amidase, family protein 3 [Sulfitobacter mediterraneus KCTC 32188]PTX74796.1 N-acetylmuramoyl-L-alanine amidase [Sulfitobacter mediterraneus]